MYALDVQLAVVEKRYQPVASVSGDLDVPSLD
jgi:hypothetical protein